MSTAVLDPYLEAELRTYGGVRLPWVLHPGEHPYSIAWRMGAGEHQLMLLWQWIAPMDAAAREAVLRAAAPVPADWAAWAVAFLAPPSEDEDDDEEDLESEELPFDEARALLAARDIAVAGEPAVFAEEL